MTGTIATREGSAKAVDIYISVGVALSWWESADDILMGVFGWLCSKAEPTAFETYVAASRSSRNKMLLSALTRYRSRFLKEELDAIRAGMKALDKLSAMRNQIAHGHVGHFHWVSDEVVVMDGHFLLPSLNETGHQIERSFRFAHTASEIDAWRDLVRAERVKIMDAHSAARRRAQEADMALTAQERSTLMAAEGIIEKRLSASDYVILHRSDRRYQPT